jgi:hypothetical protein
MNTRLLVVAAVLFAGCGDGSAPIDQAVGEYSLSTVNGESIPTSEIERGGLEIEADGTWNWWHDWRTPGGGLAMSHVAGTWIRVNATTLEFTTNAPPFAGMKQQVAVTATTVTRSSPVWVYTR